MAVLRMQVRLTFPIGAGGGTNTWHCITPDGAGLADGALLFSDAVRAFYSDVAGLSAVATRSSFDGAFSQVGVADPGLIPTVPGWEEAGAGGADYSASAAMACVTWRTGLATRRGRGRTFVGPLARSAVEGNGTLAPMPLGELRAAAAELVATGGGESIAVPAVWSETDQMARPITAGTVTDQVAVLRSRRG